MLLGPEIFSDDFESGSSGSWSAAQPAIYVVLERRDEGSAPCPKLATASPFEAQDYLDAGEDISAYRSAKRPASVSRMNWIKPLT